MGQVTIRLKDKRTGEETSPVTIEELIFNQNEIEFVFNEYDTDGFIGEFPPTLSYEDFLEYRDNYEVIIHIKGEGNSNEKSN